MPQRGFAQLLPIFVILVLLVVMVLVVHTTGLEKIFKSHAALTGTNPNLPVPQNVQVEQDDDNARLTWNNNTGLPTWFPSDQAHLDYNMGGWLVTWGQYDSSTGTIINPQKKVWPYPQVQLQPLKDGVTYAAQIQSVDYSGNTSNPTPIVTFNTDMTRVNALRQQMNGFFDDFDKPAGAFDELKWNAAYSGCTGPGPTVESQFINAQEHAHNETFDENCDRGENVSRARGIFDFTPTAARPYGTITFDFDNALSRDKWYLDIYDASNGPYDIAARNAASDGAQDATTGKSVDIDGPINDLRLDVDNGNFNVFYIDSTGSETPALASTPALPYGANINKCPKNVRCHWVVQLSPTSVKVTIDGVVAANITNLNLPYTKAYVNWVQFSYNTPKESFPDSLFHWDNFGFDAPAGYTPPIVTHNYTDGEIAAVPQNGRPFAFATAGKPVTKTIKVPDSIVGNTAQRLMFTLQQNDNSAFAWSPSDHIVFNGVSYPMPDPKTLARNAGQEPAGYQAIPMIIPVNNAQSGDNTVEFDLTNAGMLNVHLELDFPANTAPSYTQPIQIYNYNPIPLGSDVGNDATISDVAGQATWQYAPSTYTAPTALSGTAPIYFSIDDSSALNAEGLSYGVKQYQFFVDRKPVTTVATNAVVPAPSVYGVYNLDTTQLCNGQHELFIQSSNGNGSLSIPAYFENFVTSNGVYKPIFVTTNNAGQPACDATLNPSPLPSVLSTPSPVPMSSDMSMAPLPTATATPVPTPIATPVPTPTPVIGDLNGDDHVTITDVSILLSDFGHTAGQLLNPRSDINGDGVVNIVDVSILLSHYGT